MNSINLSLIKSITKNSKYYNSYDLDNWSNVPITDKSTIHNKHSEILTDPFYKDIITSRTSGSSGLILHIPWSKKDYFYSIRLLWEKRQNFGVNIRDNYITCHANYYLNNQLISNKIIINKNCHSISKLHLTEQDLERYILHIQSVRPTWMLLQPSVAYALGMYMSMHNVSINSLRYIELTGEQLTSVSYNAIKALFSNIIVANNYGMQEFNGIAYSANECNRLEIISQNVYVEVVDDNDVVVKDCSEGQIIVTGLTNTLFPLVRYRTGDYGYIVNDNNQSFLYVTKSRSNDALIYNERNYDASVFFNLTEHLNQNGFKIIQFQYQYIKNDLICYFYSSNPCIKNDVIASIIGIYMKENYFIEFSSIKVVWTNDFFKPQENNKYKYFINSNPIH